MPILLVDVEGKLIFYNEPAEARRAVGNGTKVTKRSASRHTTCARAQSAASLPCIPSG
jgi:hypothetical protein